ncbi:MAG: hypothetical protein U1F15_06195 [Burkholderiales bacterium]
MKIVREKMIHVVGTVDLDHRTGQIRYVNPAEVGIRSEAGAAKRNAEFPEKVVLQLEDAAGAVLASVEALVRLGSRSENAGRVGLIQEDVPYAPNVKRIRLLLDGQQLDVFEGGGPPAAVDANAGIALAGAAPGAPNRVAMGAAPASAEAGITYTVQARPADAKSWLTLAVGQRTPKIDIDFNQFPNAKRLDVRVLRTNGFDEAVVNEQSVDLKP